MTNRNAFSEHQPNVTLKYFMPQPRQAHKVLPFVISMRGVRKELLILTGNIQNKRSQISLFHALKLPPRLDMPNFSRQIHSRNVLRFRHTGTVLVYGRPKRLSGQASPSSEKSFQFRKKEEGARVCRIKRVW